jgi:hypothetical protein
MKWWSQMWVIVVLVTCGHVGSTCGFVAKGSITVDQALQDSDSATSNVIYLL